MSRTQSCQTVASCSASLPYASERRHDPHVVVQYRDFHRSRRLPLPASRLPTLFLREPQLLESPAHLIVLALQTRPEAVGTGESIHPRSLGEHVLPLLSVGERPETSISCTRSAVRRTVSAPRLRGTPRFPHRRRLFPCWHAGELAGQTLRCGDRAHEASLRAAVRGSSNAGWRSDRRARRKPRSRLVQSGEDDRLQLLRFTAGVLRGERSAMWPSRPKRCRSRH